MSEEIGPPGCILVLGMHRSGTSALTGMLERLGAGPPPGERLPASATNRRGYFEMREVVESNDRLLHALGTAWFDWRCIDRDEQIGRAADCEALISAVMRWSAERRLMAIKDPRICRLVPFWRAALEQAGVRPLAILPYRNPLEVAASLRARDGLPEHAGLHLWLRHVLDSEAETRDLPRHLHRYETLLTDWRAVAEKAARDLGISWPVGIATAAAQIAGFLNGAERHERMGERVLGDRRDLDTELRHDLIEAMEALAQLSIAPEDHDAAGALDSIRARFDRRVAHTGADYFRYSARVVEASQENRGLREHISELEAAIRDLKASRSWRWTAPLRAMRRAGEAVRGAPSKHLG